MSNFNFDVMIIGSGPGGYVAAIRCAQLGMKTAIVERYDALGGTCLNVGCIPSKALLDSSEHFYSAKHRFGDHGILTGDLKVDLKKMISRKDEVVKQTVEGIRFLMKKNKIEVIHGHASFENKNTISVDRKEGKKESFTAARIIIATGSKPAAIKGVTADKKRIITSTEALSLPEVPKHLMIVGGGVIGLELGSVYARLGARVSVVEYTGSLIGMMDQSLGKELERVLRKQGLTFYFSHAVSQAQVKDGLVTLKANDLKSGKELLLEGDYCLLSTGRVPYTENLGLEKAGVTIDERCRIVVNDHLETNVNGIFALGDVVRGAMLAHKAEEEGVYVAEYMAGQKPHINYRLIPNVVYTWPEVAAVGYTEAELKEMKREYLSGSFPFRASGRARASMDIDGFIKVLTDSVTDEILGVHMIGPRAADMIAEAVVAMEFRASAEDIARISHAHPTFTESFREACLDATGKRAIHI